MMKIIKKQSRSMPLQCEAVYYLVSGRRIFPFFACFILSLLLSGNSSSQIKETMSQDANFNGLKIVKSTMCEEVKDGQTFNEGFAFSSDLGKISCYTEFDPVPEKTVIYHCWYFRDNLSTRRKLILNPPRWSAFSQIQVRETEKGPWRVDITGEDGDILQTLRFSVTD